MDHTFPIAPIHVDQPPRHEYLGLSRREFLRLAGAVSALGIAALACDVSSIASVIYNRPVRKDITSSAAATDIATYAHAIDLMKALPMSDGRNWTRQSQIHLNLCRHASWLVLPWHRAYLFYFEEICRQLTGVTTFALPYWNWTANPQIPAVFWSTLNYTPRTATSSSTASASSVGSSVISSMLAQPNFLLFAGPATVLNDTSQFGPGYGLLEGTPHNYIHGFVGGTMGSFSSPLDPIFWTHHCRIDELWMEWNVLQNHPNTNNTDWTNTQFTDFVDGNGNPVTINVFATILMPLLSYKYDTM